MKKKFNVPRVQPGHKMQDPMMQDLFNMGLKMIVEEVYCLKCGKPIENVADEAGNRSDFMKERKNQIHDACLYQAYKNAIGPR